jgi:hypothetical protein
LDTNSFQNVRALDTQEGREEGRKKEAISKKNEDELSQMRIDAYFKKGREILKSRHKIN